MSEETATTTEETAAPAQGDLYAMPDDLKEQADSILGVSGGPDSAEFAPEVKAEETPVEEAPAEEVAAQEEPVEEAAPAAPPESDELTTLRSEKQRYEQWFQENMATQEDWEDFVVYKRGKAEEPAEEEQEAGVDDEDFDIFEDHQKLKEEVATMRDELTSVTKSRDETEYDRIVQELSSETRRLSKEHSWLETQKGVDLLYSNFENSVKNSGGRNVTLAQVAKSLSDFRGETPKRAAPPAEVAPTPIRSVARGSSSESTDVPDDLLKSEDPFKAIAQFTKKEFGIK